MTDPTTPPIHEHLPGPAHGAGSHDPEDTVMYAFQHDLAGGRMRDLLADADTAARARRLRAARRWARRAERATQRAARASAAVR